MKTALRHPAAIAAALFLAGSLVANAQEKTAASAARASTKPSTSKDQPSTIELGQIVGGRADGRSRTNKVHYWAFDLPAGEYKVVLEMERSDRESSNIQGEFRWLGTGGEDRGRLGGFNAIAYRDRQVGRIRLDSHGKGMISVAPADMVEYDLAIFPIESDLPVPMLRGGSAPITPIEVGQMYKTPVLQGGSWKGSACYTSTVLPAGDYRLTYTLTRDDGKSGHMGGDVHILTPDCVVFQYLGHVNTTNPTGSTSIDLLLSEERSMIIRLNSGVKAKGTFKIEPLVRD